jgi:hypothetical protein
MNRKIAETLTNSTDVNLRLTTDFMKDAMKAAKRGDIVDFCTNVRLAANFEAKIARSLALGR